MESKPSLLIPVENQVRELDPKILLACVAAQSGYCSYIGSRREMEFSIDRFPPSIYISKSMTERSLLFFRVAHHLGHKIVAWDEEALVHLPPEVYFSRRLHRSAMKYVSLLFAWGQENVELWRQYRHLDQKTPILATGNPRSDLLRPDLSPFYAVETAKIIRAHGPFILVNTNFNHVNAFGPDLNLFKSEPNGNRRAPFGRAAHGMSFDFARNLWSHKKALFASFLSLIPRLAEAFPEYTLVVRPHPTEHKKAYLDLAAQCKRVAVTNDGNIVPWLKAAKAVIHNGCTTAVEAYIMGVPAVSYRPCVNEYIDSGFYLLPNAVSRNAFSFVELVESLKRVLDDPQSGLRDNEKELIISRHIADQRGPLACEQIVAGLDKLEYPAPAEQHRRWGQALKRLPIVGALYLLKIIKSKLPGTHNRSEFQKHRFPGTSLEDIKGRADRIQTLLNLKTPIEVAALSEHLYRIAPLDGNDRSR